MRVTELVEHVEATFHQRAWRDIPDLTAAVTDQAPALSGPWRALANTFADHMRKEEMVLFPAIRRLEQGQPSMPLQMPIAVMTSDHEELEHLAEIVRCRLHEAGALRPRLQAFLDDLEKHAGYEDRTLFPAALALEEVF